MIDIGNMLVNIMQENKCSSVHALFELTEEKNYEQSISTTDVSETTADEQRNNMGTRN